MDGGTELDQKGSVENLPEAQCFVSTIHFPKWLNAFKSKKQPCKQQFIPIPSHNYLKLL